MANDLESSIRELAESRARKIELAEWLTNGLRMRASETPVTIIEAPQRDEIEIVWMSQVADATPPSPEVTTVASADEAGELADTDDAPLTARGVDVLPPPPSVTPDTLQPHLLSKDLDEEDLAVLPSRPSLRGLGSFGKLRLGAPWQALERRPAVKRSLAAAGVLLLLGALFVVRRGEAPPQIQTELAAVQPDAALLLRPSEEAQAEPPPAPSPLATSKPQPRARKATPAVDPLVDELDGPRGSSVARYPDLPNRVLSRLASQQDTVRRSEPEAEPEAEPETTAAAADDVEQPTWLLDR